MPSFFHPEKPDVSLRSWDDVDTTRNLIFDNVKNEVTKRYPVESADFRLELANVDYAKPKRYTLDEQRQAIVNRGNVDQPLVGEWRLFNKNTNELLGKSRKVVARVPYLTDRGTFILNGSEWSLGTQQRLRPGVYARKKANGELESHANLLPGTGRSFRMFMEPETGRFRFQIGQGFVPAYPILKALGASDQQLSDAWGAPIMEANRTDADFNLTRAYSKFADAKTRTTYPDPAAGIRAIFTKAEVDPNVAQRTLGKPYKNLSGEALTRALQKLLHISQGKEEEDDRDSQSNQVAYGPEDLIPERVKKDAGGVLRSTMWKLARTRDPSKIPSNLHGKQILAAITASGVGQTLQEISPIEINDQLYRVTRMGVGGIPSDQAIPDEARNVHPSQMGLIDIVKTQESNKIGVDVRATQDSYKGSDGAIYRKVLDKAGKEKFVNAVDMAAATIAFPDEDKTDQVVRAIKNGKITNVSPSEVDYWIPHGDSLFTLTSLLVPALSSVKGGRLLMGGKFFTQALSLDKPEAPLVKGIGSSGSTYEKLAGKASGAVYSDHDAVVTKVTPNSITLRTPDGQLIDKQLYNNFVYNQKSLMHNTPKVSVGQTVKPGDLLAYSNFTDSNGDFAPGTNLRVAYLPLEGTYEDSLLISQSAAKKLASLHMYPLKFNKQDGDEVSRNKFLGIFPAKYTKAQLTNLDENGIIKPGSIVNPGDPVVLAVGTQQPGTDKGILKQSRNWFVDRSMEWDGTNPGQVIDAGGKDDLKITVKTVNPMNKADKLTNRGASKGVIAEPLPDDQMPRDKDGKPFELVINPLSVVSRTNPMVLAEALLGKIARKTGKPYELPPFRKDSLIDYTLAELKKSGLSETETVYDPVSNRHIPNVFTGEQFIMKLAHMADDKWSARDSGIYTMDNTPASGSLGQSKRVGGLELNALVSSGATNVLRDFKLVRGQRNDEYWQTIRTGGQPKIPTENFVYRKFLNMLRASGVQVREGNDKLEVLPLTDKYADELIGNRFHTSGDAVSIRDDRAVPGGLYDLSLTGGRDGNRWSGIKLATPLPNPIMEDPIIRLLHLTGPKFQELLASENGPQKIKDSLAQINIEADIESAKNDIKNGSLSSRTNAVKRLRTLTMLQEKGIRPEELMLSKVPVIPPKFRPLAVMNGMQLSSDSNLLYKDLWEANQSYAEVKEALGDAGAGEERVTLYNSLKAISGLGEPVNPKNQEKGVAGLLVHIFGKGASKTGLFQRKLLAGTVDSVARGVITPDTNLNIDEIGLPEEYAWELYRPYIMRRLAKRYNLGGVSGSQVPMTDLAKWIIDRNPKAKEALLEEIKERPVIYSRAPVWHKYGILGGKPVLIPGNAIKLSPMNYPGMGGDNDGDAINIHVPSMPEAVKDVYEKMLPSRMLRQPADFKLIHVPRQEYLIGLWSATRAAKGETHEFATEADALAAYNRGEITLRTPVKIHGK